MKKRSPVAVFFLSLLTLGIYSIYWHVVTKGEMNQRGATIPTAWLLIVPIVNIWWLWKYSEGVEKVTNGRMQAVLAFILIFLLGSIGQAIIQNSFNTVEGAPVAPVSPAAPAPPVPPQSPAPPPQAPSPPATPAAPLQ